MKNNTTPVGGLKVVYNREHEYTAPENAPSQASNEAVASPSLLDALHRVVKSAQHVQAIVQHKLDRWTLGLFSQIHGMTLLKVCILGIFMFVIWRGELVLNVGIPNFADKKTNAVEKTHDKHVTTNVSNPVAVEKASFDLAPAAPEELRENQVKSYIERFSNAAVAEMDKFGIPASVSMAQAIIESRSGTSVLAQRNNNHFGIKCFSKSCPKGHCTNFTDDHHKDFFRKYPDAWQSWREHSQFLMKYRYRELLRYGKNYRAWAKGLRDFGYATDQNYDRKLIGIIERYQLHKLDDL